MTARLLEVLQTWNDPLSKLLAFGILIGWFVSMIRDWNGPPEVRRLDDELKRLNRILNKVVDKL